MDHGALHGVFLGHFLRGRYQDATAVRRAIRSQPGFSIFHKMLAAALSKPGRMDEARPAVERVLQLHPTSAVADNASPSALSQRSPCLLLKRCALRDCRTSDVS